MWIYECQHHLPNPHHCSHLSLFPLHEHRITYHYSKFEVFVLWGIVEHVSHPSNGLYLAFTYTGTRLSDIRSGCCWHVGQTSDGLLVGLKIKGSSREDNCWNFQPGSSGVETGLQFSIQTSLALSLCSWVGLLAMFLALCLAWLTYQEDNKSLLDQSSQIFHIINAAFSAVSIAGSFETGIISSTYMLSTTKLMRQLASFTDFT